MEARGQILEVRGYYIFLETGPQKLPTCKIWAILMFSGVLDGTKDQKC